MEVVTLPTMLVSATLPLARREGQERERLMRQLRKVNTLGRKVIKGWEVVDHLHSLPLCRCCLLLLFSSSAAVNTRTRAGTP